MIKRGSYLNLVFFAFSFFFMYKLLSLIKDDKKFIALGLFFAFGSTSSISLNLLIREYAMQEMFFILVCYISLLIFENSLQNKAFKVKQLFLYTVCFSLFLLSGYFSVIYFMLFFCFMLLLCLCKHNMNSLKNLIIIAVSTFVLTLVIYPDYFNLDLEYWQVKYLIFNTQNMHIAKFFQSFVSMLSAIKKYLFYPIISAILAMFLCLGLKFKWFNSLKTEFKNQKLLYVFMLTILSFVVAFAITKIAFYKDIRYIAFTFVAFSLVLTIFTYLLNKKILQYIIITLYFVCIFIPIFKPKSDAPELYCYDIMSSDLPRKQIFNSYPVIFDDPENWFHVQYIPYIDNTQYIVFVKNIKKVKFMKYFLITANEQLDKQLFMGHKYDYIYLIKNNK